MGLRIAFNIFFSLKLLNVPVTDSQGTKFSIC